MAVFREFDSRGRDRSAEDRRRHRELVEDSIKKNIADIVAEESIIGESRDKKIKIPIKGIKEYQFIYGKNQPGTGSGNGSEKKGDKLADGRGQKGKGKGNGQAGNEEGEDIYETEVTLEELIEYLFEDLDLPYLERKRFHELESEQIARRLGYQRKGIPPRLAKKRSMVERIKRKKAYERGLMEKDENPEPAADPETDENPAAEEEKRFPFKEEDLRYFRMREDTKKESNAVVICIMDTSGSMDTSKKYLARSFYFLLYQFIRMKYVNAQLVFISHTTTAKEVNEDEFFHKGESGGTYISSGYAMALDIIEKRYNPAVWNIYAFHCSDGDNWSEDNNKAVELAGELCKACNLFGYGEIMQGLYRKKSQILQEYSNRVKYDNFSIVTMKRKEDIIPSLRQLLQGDRDKGE